MLLLLPILSLHFCIMPDLFPPIVPLNFSFPFDATFMASFALDVALDSTWTTIIEDLGA